MLTVTAFSDLTSLLNNHRDSPRSVAPVGVYTDTDQRHLVCNEQLRVVILYNLKKGSIKKFWLCSLFFYCMNVNDRQEQWSRIYNLLFYTFFLTTLFSFMIYFDLAHLNKLICKQKNIWVFSWLPSFVMCLGVFVVSCAFHTDGTTLRLPPKIYQNFQRPETCLEKRIFDKQH